MTRKQEMAILQERFHRLDQERADRLNKIGAKLYGKNGKPDKFPYTGKLCTTCVPIHLQVKKLNQPN